MSGVEVFVIVLGVNTTILAYVRVYNALLIKNLSSNFYSLSDILSEQQKEIEGLKRLIKNEVNPEPYRT